MAEHFVPSIDSTIASSLRNDKGVELLDTIDKLRSLGVDSDIPLPQIVVVGTQSSGKSSVLEAISGIPFPTNDGLCTRFPLEVVMRRGAKENVAVDLICKSGNFGKDEKPLIDAFHENVNAMRPIRLTHIPEIVLMASKALSVDHGQAISSNVLRIEVTGPKQDHLTLIDLPGLFYVTKNNNDSASPAIVKSLAQRYMKQPRTIVLAIVSAKSDYATQEILKTIEDTDPGGSRTMGVITGLDRVDRGSAREKEYLALAMNDEIPLLRGWHVLRNLNFKERQDQNLHRNEVETQFFTDTEPWSTLPTETKGAQHLKTKLSQQLMHLIGTQMKSVIAALDSKIKDCNVILEKLGPDRLTIQEKRLYLFEIGNKHQNLVRDALNGPYLDTLFTEPKYRLRAQIRVHVDAFASKMRDSGHTWEIFEGSQAGVFKFDDPVSKTYAIGGTRPKLVNHQPSQISAKTYLGRLVEDVLAQHRTLELPGTFDPLVVSVLFRDQSQKWKDLGGDFVEGIKSMVREFMRSVTKHLADARRAQLLFDYQIQPALKVREQALDLRFVEILKPYQKHHPFTCDDVFDDFVEDRPKPTSIFGDKVHSKNDEIQTTTNEAERDHPEARILLKHMQSYYAVAVRTFVDNVVTLGIESCLLDDLETVLGQLVMARLSDAEVERLASESGDDREIRRINKSKLDKLTKGRAVCQLYEHHIAAEGDAEPGLTVEKNGDISRFSTGGFGQVPVPRHPNPFDAPAFSFSQSNDYSRKEQPRDSSPWKPTGTGLFCSTLATPENRGSFSGNTSNSSTATLIRRGSGSSTLGRESVSSHTNSSPFAQTDGGAFDMPTPASSRKGASGRSRSKSPQPPMSEESEPSQLDKSGGGRGLFGNTKSPLRNTCELTSLHYPLFDGVPYMDQDTFSICQSITATMLCWDLSFEELRLADINDVRCF